MTQGQKLLIVDVITTKLDKVEWFSTQGGKLILTFPPYIYGEKRKFKATTIVEEIQVLTEKI